MVISIGNGCSECDGVLPEKEMRRVSVTPSRQLFRCIGETFIVRSCLVPTSEIGVWAGWGMWQINDVEEAACAWGNAAAMMKQTAAAGEHLAIQMLGRFAKGEMPRKRNCNQLW